MLYSQKMATIIDPDCGYLELIVGPMYSGKTSKLLALYKQFTFCDIPTLVINYGADNRYSAGLELVSHDLQTIPCLKALALNEVLETDPLFLAAKVVLINEGQFFPDCVAWVKRAVEVYQKVVYVCGLDGDYQRQPFSNDWLQLVPFCDKIIKLHSFCSHCKTKRAIFSHRLSSETAQQVIGSDMYIPLCRRCFTVGGVSRF